MTTRRDLERIGDALLDPSCSDAQLRQALSRFIRICSAVGGIAPDAAFDAWAGDLFLANGVAIAPQAAAHCAHDYYRAVMYIRGIHAAIEQLQQSFPDQTLHVLYAGCGPYATLLLPLLPRYRPAELTICLLDIHAESLRSVARLLDHFQLDEFAVQTQQQDACHYVHPGPLHLIISETMQKSLEQEPQFAVTAQLAPQLLAEGIWIPQNIEVRLCLVQTNSPPGDPRGPGGPGKAEPACAALHPLGHILKLNAANAATLLKNAAYHPEQGKWQLQSMQLEVPALEDLSSRSAVFFTRIQVYGQFWLEDLDAEITLPQPCTDLSPLQAGDQWEISYQLGNYPRFHVRRNPAQAKSRS